MNHPIRRMLCGILPFVLALSLFGCARDVRPSEGVGKVKLCEVIANPHPEITKFLYVG